MIERTIRLLVVDDDPSLLAVLEMGLSQQPDYQVKAVDNARQALKELDTGQWDLVITDYSLNDPEINGIDLLRVARNLPQPPLVIIITAFASLQITLESINLGVHNFLTKPFQLDELYLVARNAVSVIHMERENQALTVQVAEQAKSLKVIEESHRQLMDRLRSLEYEGFLADGIEEPPVAVLNTTSAMELRRRRMKEQVTAYLRAGETIEHELGDQRARTENELQERNAV